MHLGILQVDSVLPQFQPEHGDYPEMFGKLLRAAKPDVVLTTFDVVKGELPAPEACAGYLITGSRQSVYDDLPWIGPLVEFLSELRERHIKVAGICFGHQLIAHFFGGRVGPASGGWAVGVHASDLVTQPAWMQPAKNELSLLSSHKDQVLELPADAELYASNSFCPYAGFLVSDHTMTIQGHPEFRKGYARELMTAREELLGPAVFAEGLASLDQDTDQELVGRWLVNFFSQGHTGS